MKLAAGSGSVSLVVGMLQVGSWVVKRAIPEFKLL